MYSTFVVYLAETVYYPGKLWLERCGRRQARNDDGSDCLWLYYVFVVSVQKNSLVRFCRVLYDTEERVLVCGLWFVPLIIASILLLRRRTKTTFCKHGPPLSSFWGCR
jgi:hypothetical protein